MISPRKYKDSESSGNGASTTFDMIQQCQDYILNLFNRSHDTRLLYHNYQRTTEIVKRVEQIATVSNVDEITKEVVVLAAWFNDIGYLYEYNNHVNKSEEIAREFLSKKNYPEDKLARVLSAIRATKEGVQAKATEEKILSDADSAFGTTNNFFQARPLLRLEWELYTNRHISNLEWAQLQLQYLLSTKFSTAYAKTHFEPILAQNILAQKRALEKQKLKGLTIIDEQEGQLRKYQDLERKNPERATQTFFRATYRTHINLSIIADNKANIMISVNAILISVVISLLSYKNIAETNPMVLLPVVIFLVTGLASLIFAVLSIRPKVTNVNKEGMKLEEVKKNLIFFGNFVQLNLEQYEEAMDTMLRDGELMYGNMSRDLYFLGKVLDKKYRYLTTSYNIFMVGFVATVLSFLAIIFMF